MGPGEGRNDPHAAGRRTVRRLRRSLVVAALGAVAFVPWWLWQSVPRGRSRAAGSAVAVGPAIRWESTAPASVTVRGTAGPLPWPATGQAAWGLLGQGVVAASPDERPAPIASLTKMMTALIVLADRPLRLHQAGPILTMTEADARAWAWDVAAGDSSLRVMPGERLSEYQLLEALLIPSADNVARILATWAAGSRARFVAQMNAEARRLGLTETHYAGPSGLDPRTVSTASDQVRVAEAAMANPVVREIVDQSTAVVGSSGPVFGYNPLLGRLGVVGVKSGFTDAAAACLAIAARRQVGGATTTVFVVDLGQPDGLAGAAAVDADLLGRITADLRALAPPSGAVAWVEVEGRTLDLVASSRQPVVVAVGGHYAWRLHVERGRFDMLGRPLGSLRPGGRHPIAPTPGVIELVPAGAGPGSAPAGTWPLELGDGSGERFPDGRVAQDSAERVARGAARANRRCSLGECGVGRGGAEGALGRRQTVGSSRR